MRIGDVSANRQFTDLMKVNEKNGLAKFRLETCDGIDAIDLKQSYTETDTHQSLWSPTLTRASEFEAHGRSHSSMGCARADPHASLLVLAPKFESRFLLSCD